MYTIIYMYIYSYIYYFFRLPSTSGIIIDCPDRTCIVWGGGFQHFSWNHGKAAMVIQLPDYYRNQVLTRFFIRFCQPNIGKQRCHESWKQMIKPRMKIHICPWKSTAISLYIKNGGFFWMMINPYPYYKTWRFVNHHTKNGVWTSRVVL